MVASSDAIARWPGLRLDHRIAEGNRGEVWAATSGPSGERVAVRRSRRSAASLEWELDLIADLGEAGFLVPTIVTTEDGRRSVDGVVVQRWISGREPASPDDWRAVAATLHRLHTSASERPQRPGCSVSSELTRDSTSVDADLSALPDGVATELVATFRSLASSPISVIHGDPNPTNLRITDDGRVGLLDFDESRIDHCWHDLSNLGVQILDDDDHAAAQRLSHAWEAANAWIVEPDYARRRLAALRA